MTIEVLSQDIKPTVQVIDQSEKYKIVDNIFKLRKLYDDSSIVRLKTGSIHQIDTGKYQISFNFYARWGIYVNEGTLKKGTAYQIG